MSKEYDGVFLGETTLSAERLRDEFSSSFGIDVDDYLVVTSRALRNGRLRGVPVGNLVVVEAGVALSTDIRVALESAVGVGRRGVQELKVWALR